MGLASRLVGTLAVAVIGAGVIGAVVLAPRVLQAARPALRKGLKRALSAYAAVRTAAAEFGEDVEDLFAEVRQEMKAANEHKADDAGEAVAVKQA